MVEYELGMPHDGDMVIGLKNGVVCKTECRLNTPINLTINKGEQLAVIGPNGSGKTILVNTLLGQYRLMEGVRVTYGNGITGQDVKNITFRDSYGSADSTNCYQLRWNSTETDEVPLVRELFPTIPDGEWRYELVSLFGLEQLWDKKIVSLSSGEMRKYQLAKALASRPKLIFVESPFIGLDEEARHTLTELLERMAQQCEVQSVLVVSRKEDIPSFITHVIPVENMECGAKITKEEFENTCSKSSSPLSPLTPHSKEIIRNLPCNDHLPHEILFLNRIHLQYGTRVILDSITWRVNKGEHWALLGPNGSGKSALLSLIYADNPQAYAQDITLFGRKRGTGESIWEIKREIGYVSPEMHRSYTRHYPVMDIVASGLHDSIGLYVKITDSEREACRKWMEIFQIERLSDRDFYTLSSGEQRLVLLARAFVKNPALLILDEPLHGLDTSNRCLALDIIRTYAENPERTVIMVTHYPEELPFDALRLALRT